MGDVLGGPAQALEIVAEHTERAVVALTDEPSEAGRAAALRGMTMQFSTPMAMVDRVELAERLATDETPATLRRESSLNL